MVDDLEMTDSHDEWYTQTKDYDEWCNKYNIRPYLDVAASRGSHMCESYLTKSVDALTLDWDEDFFMNPPLLGGLTKKFVLYAYDQAFKNNVNGLCLIPAGVIARQWFRPIWDRFVNNTQGGNVTIDPIHRPSFHDHGQAIGQQARNDYIMLVLRGR